MKRLYRSLTMLVIALLVVAALPASAQEEEPARTGLRPDAPPYAIRGPYPVGTMEFVIEDEDRALPVTMWYPALNPESLDEAISYTIDYPDFWQIPAYSPPQSIQGHAILNASPATADGPYPLVIFSHGNYGQRYQSNFLTEHLASYGFVVMALDHWGNTVANVADPFYPYFIIRPLDIKRVMVYVDTLTAADGAMAGLIDTSRVAVSGHSWGGSTAMLAGGALMDTAAFSQWCEAHPGLDVGGCDLFKEHQGELAELAGLDAVPDTLWPSLSTPGIDAIVGLAPDPAGRLFGPDGTVAVQVPTLLMVGSADTWEVPEHNAYSAYEYLNVPKSLVVFENGDHMLFGNSCRAAPWLVEMGVFPGCSDPVWDMDRAHDLTNHFTTAFLLSVLKDDADAAAALAPDAVSFPGITYETTLGQ